MLALPVNGIFTTHSNTFLSPAAAIRLIRAHGYRNNLTWIIQKRANCPYSMVPLGIDQIQLDNANDVLKGRVQIIKMEI